MMPREGGLKMWARHPQCPMARLLSGLYYSAGLCSCISPPGFVASCKSACAQQCPASLSCCIILQVLQGVSLPGFAASQKAALAQQCFSISEQTSRGYVSSAHLNFQFCHSHRNSPSRSWSWVFRSRVSVLHWLAKLAGQFIRRCTHPAIAGAGYFVALYY